MSANASVRVGIIGAGAVARRHAATLASFPDVRVTAVADVDRVRAQEMASTYGARPYNSFAPMLEGDPLDAVYVCVPPFAHGPPELAAIDAGLPLFVEKPVAIDVATAEAIAAAARERDVVTAVGYHLRYLETVERARELVRRDPARLIVLYWLDKTPPPSWWHVRACSGGQTVEQTTHVLDLLRFVAGEVIEIYAREARCARDALPASDVGDVTVASLTLESGTLAAVMSTCLLSAKHRAGLELFCDGMAIELSETELAVTRAGSRLAEPSRADAKALVDRDFIDAVKGEQNRIRAPYDEALKTHRLACAIAAAASGR